MKLKDENIIEKVLLIHPNNKVLKIYRKEEYGKNRIYIDYICGECGAVWEKYNWDAMKKKKTKYCKKCGKQERKYTINFIEEELIKLGFKWLNKEQYVDANSSLETQCIKCGEIAKANVTNRIIDKRQCNRCIGHAPKTIEEFKKEVYELEGDSYTVLSDIYTEAHATNILIKHNKCGCEYLVSRNNFRKGRRCPKCSTSKGEEFIIKYLDSQNIEYIYDREMFDDLRGIGGGILRYDFYLPKYNLLIEYQGIQHEKEQKGFGDFERQQEHDKRKRKYAEEHNIKLLEIWYYDFDNIENILKGVLGNE